MSKMKVSARYLMTGDQLCTGETIVGISRGVRTPPGKVEVTLEKNGLCRAALWGAATTINVTRQTPDPVEGKVRALGSLLSELAVIALNPDSIALLAGHADALKSALTTHQLICSACVAEPRKEVNERR